jgi:hypothetical protein
MLLFLAFGVTLLPSAPAVAAEGKKGPALTAPPEGDANYALLGEYLGPIATGENEYEPLGLQVRPVGGDRFEAVQFRGGLPGQPKHDPEGTKLLGSRSGDFIVLSGGPWAIFVEHDHCLIVDRQGQQVGRLERVQRQSPTLNAAPPHDAVVLFDGSGTEQFTKAEMTEEGLLMQGADIKPMFQDFDLHLEFRLPYMPEASDQSRGNSGVYLQSRYECQVLDSFAQDRLFNGCGALYRFRKPDLNMCFPPLSWQTYDIRFTAPRWAADGTKIRDAHVTSWLNGVKVQDNVALPNKTGAGKPEAPLLLPTRLQDHGDPVRFRNIWVVDRGLTTGVAFPVEGGPSDDQAAPAKAAKPDKPAGEEATAKADQPKPDQPQQDAKDPEKKPDAPSKAETDSAPASPDKAPEAAAAAAAAPQPAAEAASQG